MTATLTRVAPTRHSGGASALASRIGRRLGCTPATAEQKLWGNSRMTIDELAAAVEECVAAGRSDVADRLTRKITAALAGVRPMPLPIAAVEARQADAAEDVAETRFLATHADKALEEELRAVEAEIREKDAFRVSLIAEQHRRARGA